MKNTKIIIAIIVGLLITTLSACKKEDNTDQNPQNGSYKIELGANKTASFYGTIIDENHQVLSGVSISIGNKSTVTDVNGVFLIADATVNENLAYIKAEKNGYFLGSRSIVPTEGVNSIKIMMLQKENIGSFDASVGGTIIGNGLKIVFQSGIVDESGNAYTGTVQVAAKHIDPLSDDFFDYMPGNLVGADASGEKYLESFGMAAIELSDGSGNALQPAPGKTAQVSFPLSASLLANAEASIPLWHFDELKGYWIQEGSATLSNGEYIAELSHFSFWGCCGPQNKEYLFVRVEDVYGNGIPNALVRVISTNYNSASDYTSQSGHCAGRVPSGEPLNIQVFINCGSGYILEYSASLGSLSSTTFLSPIVINSSQYTLVTGTLLDCNLSPIQNGYIKFGDSNIAPALAGSYTFAACPGIPIDLKGIDYINSIESNVVSITPLGNTFNAGTLNLCSTLSEFISWSINGVEYQSVNPLYNNGTSFPGDVMSGSLPNTFSFGALTYGIRDYTIGIISAYNLNMEGLVTDIDSGFITLSVQQWGANPGDLVSGVIAGTVRGPSPSNPNISITQTVNGSFQVIRD